MNEVFIIATAERTDFMCTPNSSNKHLNHKKYFQIILKSDEFTVVRYHRIKWKHEEPPFNKSNVADKARYRFEIIATYPVFEHTFYVRLVCASSISFVSIVSASYRIFLLF